MPESAEIEEEKLNNQNVDRRIKVQLMEFAKIDEETARRVVLAVKKIDDLNITY